MEFYLCEASHLQISKMKISEYVNQHRQRIILDMIRDQSTTEWKDNFFANAVTNQSITEIVFSSIRNVPNIYYQKYLKYVHIGYARRFISPVRKVWWVVYQYFRIGFRIENFAQTKCRCLFQPSKFVLNDKTYIKLKIYKMNLIKLLS